MDSDKFYSFIVSYQNFLRSKKNCIALLRANGSALRSLSIQNPFRVADNMESELKREILMQQEYITNLRNKNTFQPYQDNVLDAFQTELQDRLII